MADKDVRLVIRAKNEASKVFDATADSAAEFAKQTAKAGETTKRFDNLITPLVSEIKKLNAEISGLEALGKLNVLFSKAGGAVTKLEENLNKTHSELTNLNKDLKASTEEVQRLQKASDSLRQSQLNQAEAIKAGRAELKDANKQLRDAERAYKAVSRAADKHTSASPWSSAAESAKVFAQAEVTKAASAVDDTRKSYESLDKELKKTKQSILETSVELRNAVAAEEKLSNQSDKLTRSSKRQADALADAKKELSSLKDMSQTVATQMGKVSASQDEIAKASIRAKDALESTSKLYQTLNKFSDASGGFTDPKSAAALRAQRDEVEKARASYTLLRAEADKLRGAMRAGVAPTEAQRKSFVEMSKAAHEAEKELRRQIAALNALPGATVKMNGIRGMFQGIYGDSRKAMSMLQRLRGEVLSLTAAYVGLHAAVGQISGVIGAYQKLEAAQNRISVVMGQNQSATAKELEWISRQAGRLGIEFGVLADEYSKFAVAAKQANFESATTRKVFLSVAEAARVNKNSMEQMSGIFLALTQMISKGKIQSEELRRQLGDRMAGAFNLMAKAIGVTTEELDEMMRKGQVLANEDNFLKFAKVLDATFGPQLEESLKTTTTLMGNWANEVYQAQLRIGKGGFIKEFNGLLADMIQYFQSREGRDFFLSIGSALGTATKALKLFLNNMELVVSIVKLFIGYKLVKWFIDLGTALMGKVIPAYGKLRIAMISANAAWAASTTAVAGLTRALTILGTAMMRLAPVAIVTGALLLVEKLFGSWVGGVEEATRATDEYERVFQKVLNAYDQAIAKGEQWQKVAGAPSLRETERALEGLAKAYDENIESIKKTLTSVPRLPLNKDLQVSEFDTFSKFRKTVSGINTDTVEGLIKLRTEAEKLNKAAKTRALKDWVGNIIDAADAAIKTRPQMANLAAASKDLGSSADLVNKILKETPTTVKDAASSLEDAVGAAERASKSVSAYQAALENLEKAVPSLKSEAKKMKDYLSLEEAGQAALKALSKVDNSMMSINDKAKEFAKIISTLQEGKMELDIKNLPGALKEERQAATPAATQKQQIVQAAAEIAGAVGAKLEDVLAVMHFESSFRPSVMGGKNGQYYGLFQFGPSERKKYGMPDDASIAQQVQPIIKYLLDRGFKKGMNDLDLYSTVNAGKPGLYNRSDEKNGGRKGTVADKVASKEFEQSRKIAKAYADAYSDVATSAQRTSEEVRKQQESTEKTIKLQDREIKLNNLKLEGKTKEAYIEAGITKARDENKNLSAADLAMLEKQLSTIYDQEQALTKLKKEKSEIEKLEARLTTLQERRNLIEQRRQTYSQRGDYKGVARMNSELLKNNEEQKRAIQLMIEYWQKAGGPEADSAIMKLQAMQLELERTGQMARWSAEEISGMMASSGTNAFEQFAKAIASGENAIKSLGQTFLQFAADTLIQLGRMIVQALLFRLIMGAIGGPIAGFMNGLVPVMHTGGIAGRHGGAKRAVNPAWFSSPVFYHSGGIAGLRPDEVPAILQAGEEVIRADDPRHRNNMTPAPASSQNIKIVNTFDSGDVVSEGLNTATGEQVFMNVVRKNRSAVREVLGL